MEGWGSATYIGNGYFLTANHVAEWTGKLVVVTDTGLKVNAKVTFLNHVYDFAVIHIDSAIDMRAVPMACDNPAVTGDHVRLFGNPEDSDFIVTQGYIAGKDRPITVWPDVFPVDATISWGMSGGGMLNDDGELVGVNIGIMLGAGGRFPMPISYAVPVQLACNAINFYHVNI
jgi:S1-C subfamily serine protease